MYGVIFSERRPVKIQELISLGVGNVEEEAREEVDDTVSMDEIYDLEEDFDRVSCSVQAF